MEYINSLNCLKRCGMGVAEMKAFLALCLQGQSSIPARKIILAEKRRTLLAALAEVKASIDYIDAKQQFYADVLAGKAPYYSNLIAADADEKTAADA